MSLEMMLVKVVNDLWLFLTHTAVGFSDKHITVCDWPEYTSCY